MTVTVSTTIEGTHKVIWEYIVHTEDDVVMVMKLVHFHPLTPPNSVRVDPSVYC